MLILLVFWSFSSPTLRLNSKVGFRGSFHLYSQSSIDNCVIIYQTNYTNIKLPIHFEIYLAIFAHLSPSVIFNFCSASSKPLVHPLGRVFASTWCSNNLNKVMEISALFVCICFKIYKQYFQLSNYSTLYLDCNYLLESEIACNTRRRDSRVMYIL